MKRLALTAWCLVLLAALAAATTPSKTKSEMNKTATHQIMVISDIHLLAPELYDNGAAAQRLAANDMKLVLHSDLIMQRIVDHAIAEKPSLLLITGDLTFNGARVSHERLTHHLARLAKAGVRTLVIPGNHDISCPNARSYRGDKASPVATITRKEFAQIYHNYGYGNDAIRDPHSMSYICEPLPGLMVLGIDSNRDEENQLTARGDTANVYHNGGRVKAETLQWVQQQVAEAHRQGKRVVAMMHHHLLEHIDGEARFLPNYIVTNHDQVTQALADCGVHAVFTGHLHITDAVTNGQVTDISTGSASMYPLPLRFATIEHNLDSLQIETRFFDALPDDVLQSGRDQLTRSTPILAGVIASRLWPRIQRKMPQLAPMLESQGVDVSLLPQNALQATGLMMRHMQEPLTRSLLTVTQGGEDPHQAQEIVDAVKQGVQGMIDETMPTQAKYMGPFLIDNLFPRVEPMLRSALEDRNQVGTPQESSTPDHRLTVAL